MVTSTKVTTNAAFSSFDSQHEDMIHDAQMDYYGRHLATASSDKTVRIFSYENGSDIPSLEAVLKGHDGPVWQVAWSHPSYGPLLASAGYDGLVIVWRNFPENGGWCNFKEIKVHSSSVNSLCFAPVEYDCVLVAGSSDGKISTSTLSEDGKWKTSSFHAHQIGVNSVGFAPVVAANGPLMLASGGCDNLVKLWIWNEEIQNWKENTEFNSTSVHSDWVRDVAWCPNICGESYILASASQDKTVVIWTFDDESKEWSHKPLSKAPFSDAVWRLSWSYSGVLLAVSCGDNKVKLFKQADESENDAEPSKYWGVQVQDMDESNFDPQRE